MSFVKEWFKRHDDGTWGVLLFIALLPPILVGLLWAASMASDNGRVPAALAAAAQESGVMVCADGSIDHGDSWIDRIFSDGRFRCTSWRMRAKPVIRVLFSSAKPSSTRTSTRSAEGGGSEMARSR
jgi:hypothetical protein